MAAGLAAMVDGGLALIEVDPLDSAAIQTHAGERGERLFELAGVALGLDADMAVIRRLGRGWALIDLASRLTQARARKEAITLAADALAARAGPLPFHARPLVALAALARGRSEEHTSELQSLMRISYAVFCLTKKNQYIKYTLT